MKIVDLDAFLQLPAETLYSKYEPCAFDSLEIKGKSILDTKDFYTQQLADAVACRDSTQFFDILFTAKETGSSFKLDFDCEGRDGCFEAGQLFAVWEADDVQLLLARLQRVLESSRILSPDNTRE